MSKKQIIIIIKWIVMGLLVAFNFLSYLANGTMINMAMAILVIIYSVNDFLHVLSGLKLQKGMKLYLITFYLFAVISLFVGINSLLTGNQNSLLSSIFFMASDIALILYTLHKLNIHS